jgi:hypothetical protein
VQNISFTEYRLVDGSEKIYLLNIDWWDSAPATCDVVIDGVKYPLAIQDNFIKLLVISSSGKTAVFCDDERIDVRSVTDEEVVLYGFANTKIVIFAQGERKVISVRVAGEKTEKLKK